MLIPFTMNLYGKRILFCCVIAWSLACVSASAQDQKIADSLALIYQKAGIADTIKLKMLTDLSFNETRDLAKGVEYADEMIKLAGNINNIKFLRAGYFLKGNKKRMQGKPDEALEAYIKSAEIARKDNNTKAEAECYCAIGDTYAGVSNYQTALPYYKKAISYLQGSDNYITLASVCLNMGEAYLTLKQYDSSLMYSSRADSLFAKAGYEAGSSYAMGNMGMAFMHLGDTAKAETNMTRAISILEASQDYYPITVYLLSLADIQWSKGNKANAFSMALRSYSMSEQNSLTQQLSDASLKLSTFYESTGDAANALAYYKTYITSRDSVNNLVTVQKMADLRTNYEVSQKQAEVNQLNRQKLEQRKLSMLLAIILSLTIVVLALLFKYNKNKQKAYAVLNLQTQETEKQKQKAETALEDLKSTQKMLIHSAKMASLGELTAGIAHEIQNPLNFVNNFAEVSAELLQELQQETSKKSDENDKVLIGEIISDLGGNLKKIKEHGKRADAIVRGMQEHARTSSGRKELTDINAFAEEYLQLSFHGFRAKDQHFTATLHKHFDKAIGKVHVIPQDLGRVLLNLYNNAFYAVREKQRNATIAYNPEITVTTSIRGTNMLLVVRDNGTGVPNSILDKIFHPFFTTKPTGQGTGLGLSLSYDIVKAHNGEMTVHTEEGKYTEFIIELPMNR